jgi:leucyl-tRNA synthetase
MTLTTSRPLAEESANYDPAAIEEKWQARWQAQGTNRADLDRGERPYYVLMMFPYPSAEGLHIGNLFAFTGNDIFGRFQRLQGHTVFEPIGFDAFGIHSENYALKVDIHPLELIPPASCSTGTMSSRRPTRATTSGRSGSSSSS